MKYFKCIYKFIFFDFKNYHYNIYIIKILIKHTYILYFSIFLNNNIFYLLKNIIVKNFITFK